MDTKLQSETSGFENIGKLYLHIHEQKNLSYRHREIYMMMGRYSFGYTNNIKFEIQISNKQISEELGYSKTTVIKAIKELIELGLIQRVKWQNFGPKQSYSYKVMLPKKYHIKITEPEMKENLTKTIGDQL